MFVADLSVVIKKIDLGKKSKNDFIMNDVLMIQYVHRGIQISSIISIHSFTRTSSGLSVNASMVAYLRTLLGKTLSQKVKSQQSARR